LATSPLSAGATLGTTLNGTTVTLTDSAGATFPSSLFFVGPTQVNYLIPDGAATGAATISVKSGDGTVTAGNLNLVSVAPGLYSADGRLASALVVRADQAGHQTAAVLVVLDSNNKLVTTPINLDPPTDVVFLELYGTGIRNAPISDVTLNVGGKLLTPAYASAAPGYPGEDQVNVQLPYLLKGSGDTTITITAGGITSEPVHVTIQ